MQLNLLILLQESCHTCSLINPYKVSNSVSAYRAHLMESNPIKILAALPTYTLVATRSHCRILRSTQADYTLIRVEETILHPENFHD